MLPSSVRVLLRASKSKTPPSTWKEVREVLEPFYFPDMALNDVMAILTGVYLEVSKEPKFCMNLDMRNLSGLLMAPITGIYQVSSSKQLTDMLAIEDFYDSMVLYIVSELRTSTVDWCRAELFAEVPHA